VITASCRRAQAAIPRSPGLQRLWAGGAGVHVIVGARSVIDRPGRPAAGQRKCDAKREPQRAPPSRDGAGPCLQRRCEPQRPPRRQIATFGGGEIGGHEAGN